MGVEDVNGQMFHKLVDTFIVSLIYLHKILVKHVDYIKSTCFKFTRSVDEPCARTSLRIAWKQ